MGQQQEAHQHHGDLVPTVPVTGRADLTDAQWAVLEPLLPRGKKPGRRRKYPRRQLIDGIRWRVRTGVPWRDVPERYGPWQSVSGLFRRWQRDGTWRQIVTALQARADAAGLITWDVSVRQRRWRVVVYHAADNSFPAWKEYNEMIGVGGWGGRNEKSGPYVRWRNGGVVLDTTPGPGGSHGPQHPFQVVIRDFQHPITKGLPDTFMHTADELYNRLRGPAKNLTVLATAFSPKEMRGTGENEPMLWHRVRRTQDFMVGGQVSFHPHDGRGQRTARRDQPTQRRPVAGQLALVYRSRHQSRPAGLVRPRGHCVSSE